MSSDGPPTTRPQASIELDLSDSVVAKGIPSVVPATASQIASELCTFREDVYALRLDLRKMTERLGKGQDSLIDGNTRIEGLLERIAAATELASVEMDKLEDVVRRRADQEEDALRRSGDR